MQLEPARGSNPDPQRTPAPPVTTRRLYSDVPDPGAASGRLPPFRPRSMAASLHHDRTDPGDVDFEETTNSGDVDLEPVAEIVLDSETPSEPDASADTDEAGRLEQPEQALVADFEETWLLDEVVEADAETDQVAAPPWSAPDEFTDFDFDITAAPGSDEIHAAASDGTAAPASDEADADEPDEERWDALGEALQRAVAEADPPLAEDLVRSSEPADDAAPDEPGAAEPAPGPSLPEESEPQGGAVPVAGPAGGSGRGTPNVPSRPPARGDRFSEGLAATLESLAGSLRARGIDALDDAFARGDRLESSLALFLAGYRAGRGE